MQLPRFTLLGATTRMGLLSAPLLDRFGFHWQLRYYDLPDMKAIVKRSALLIGVRIDEDGATEIAAAVARHPADRQSPAAPGARLRDGRARRPDRR